MPALTSAADATEIPDDPGRIFAELIRDEREGTQNARVCQNCFTRLFRAEPFDTEVGLEHGEHLANVGWTVPTGARHPLLEREYRETVRLENRVDVEYIPGDGGPSRALVCAECGHADFHRVPSRRSKSELLSSLEVLARTLREYGVELDEATLRRETDRLKSEVGGETGDGEVLRRAVAVAVHSHP